MNNNAVPFTRLRRERILEETTSWKEHMNESWKLNSYHVLKSRLSELRDSKSKEEKTATLGMSPPTCDKRAMDVDKNDFKSKFWWWNNSCCLSNNTLDSVEKLTDKTKIFWKERSNALNAWPVLGSLSRIPQYLQETVFLCITIWKD